MGSYVLSVCLFNFIAGFVAAMYLHNPRSLRIPRRRKSSGLSVPAATPTLATTPGESNEELDWGLGPEWTELLSKDEASLAPCPTTVIHAMRLWLELSYQLLLRCESNVRYAGRDAEQMAVEKLDLKEIEEICGSLIKRLTEASALLAKLPVDQATSQLDDRIHDLRFQVLAAAKQLPFGEKAEKKSISGKRCLSLVGELARDCHRFRDGIVEHLAILASASEGDIAKASSKWTTDPVTGVANRVGFQQVIEQLGEQTSGPIRICAVRIDRFEPITQLIGPNFSDQILTEFGNLLLNLIPNADESLELARLHDFTFALCLVGADQNTAETATERMRQAVEANSFKADKQMVEFTISCAILEVSKDEHTNDLIDRVSRVLNMVVDAGGNRTGTDHEGVIALIEPRAFQVRSRLIELVATFGKPRAPVLSVTSLSAENARRAAQVSDHLQLRKATQLPGELEASLGDHGTEFDE